MAIEEASGLEMPRSKATPGQAIAVHTLLISRSVPTIELLSEQIAQLSAQVETCCDLGSATRILCRAKFEGVIVDCEMGEEALKFLQQLRDLTAHRHVVAYAIVDSESEVPAAFRAHANFVLWRPLSIADIARTFRASYAIMFRERRRYYRYPIAVPTCVKTESGLEFDATSINISETGICIQIPHLVKPGDQLRLRVELPNLLEPFTTWGEVCWADANGRVGIRFVNVRQNLGERLQQWLSEKMNELVARD
jgi:CheY-like chemotaxis protein